MGHCLILGGARSGKTTLAERLAMRLGDRPAYLATAESLDEEMADRVDAHRRSRAANFATIEEPLELPEALFAASQLHDVILVDCITLWITNLIAAERDVADEIETLLDTLRTIESSKIILVSNEVGLGIVPDNALARTFRDLSGSAHQQIAEICTEVYFVVAGLSLTVKGEPLEL